MPAISTLSLCANIPGENTFEHANPNFVAQDPPAWFNLEVTGVNLITGDTGYKYTVQPNEFVGTHTIYITEDGSNYIVVTITNCEPDYTVTGCVGDIEDSAFLEVSEGFGPWEPYTELPEGVTLEGEGVPGEQYLHVIITAPTVYNITLVSENEGGDKEYIVIRITPTDCWEEIDPCEMTGSNQYLLNLAWFNRDGGWESYIFSTPKVFKKRIGGTTVFKTTGFVSKYVSIKGVYNARDVKSGHIPLSHLNKLEEMEYTIQAYLWNDTTENWDVPILIDAESFVLKEEGNGFYNYNFSFIYATELKVQNG
jgi:hypothetical protein